MAPIDNPEVVNATVIPSGNSVASPPQVAVLATPTQVRRPGRAVIRTALAVGIPAILLLPTIIQMVIDELGPNLPPSVTAWLVGAGAFITAVAALITRILALPQVEALLRSTKLLSGFAAAPAAPGTGGRRRDESGHADVDITFGVLVLLAGVVLAAALLISVLVDVARYYPIGA